MQYEITRKDGVEIDSASWEARALRKHGLGSDADGSEEEEDGGDDWPLPEVV